MVVNFNMFRKNKKRWKKKIKIIECSFDMRVNQIKWYDQVEKFGNAVGFWMVINFNTFGLLDVTHLTCNFSTNSCCSIMSEVDFSFLLVLCNTVKWSKYKCQTGSLTHSFSRLLVLFSQLRNKHRIYTQVSFIFYLGNRLIHLLSR